MAFRCKLRSLSIPLQRRRHFSASPSAILGSSTPLSSEEKSRAALSLLGTETNPERILEICRAAALTPASHIDRLAYSKAIYKLKDSQSYDDIKKFLEESKAMPDNLSEKKIGHFIVLYGQAGLLPDAIQTFEEVEKLGIKRTVKSLNSLLFACLVAKDYGTLKRVYVDFPNKYGLTPDLETYNTVIKGFCESGESNSIYSILDEMKTKGVKANATTFTVMIAAFYEEKKFQDVEKALVMLRKFRIKGVSIYNVRIQGLCKLKRTKEARALLDELLAKAGYVKPNCVTYTHLVHGFCKEGNMEEALRNFEEMKRKKLLPLSDCYFTLVYNLCEAKDFKGALKICKECMEKNWIPNFSVMKSLVDGLVSISEVEAARQIVGQMKEKFEKSADKWSEIEEGLPK